MTPPLLPALLLNGAYGIVHLLQFIYTDGCHHAEQ